MREREEGHPPSFRMLECLSVQGCVYGLFFADLKRALCHKPHKILREASKILLEDENLQRFFLSKTLSTVCYLPTHSTHPRMSAKKIDGVSAPSSLLMHSHSIH